MSGATRFDYEMQRAFGARVVSKGGAEGLQAIGFTDPPLGIVVKVLDGGDRACAPICLAVLRELGLLQREAMPGARRAGAPVVTNYRGIETGAIVASVTLGNRADCALTTPSD